MHRKINSFGKKKQDYFQRKMKEEFLIDHVVYGHVPRDHKKGQRISSGNGFAIK